MLQLDQPTTSSRCGSQACVEATLTTFGVLVADTKPGGGAVVVSVEAWRGLIAAVKDGVLKPERIG